MKDLLKKSREQVWLEKDPDKDWSRGLFVAGLLEMALGILAFSSAMLLMVIVSKTGYGILKPIQVGQCMFLLLFLTGWWIVMGFGSLKARRWAGVLILAGSWVAIFFGSLFMALILYVLPEVHSLMMDSGLWSPSAALNAVYLTVLLLLLLQLVIPLISIAFYSLKGVESTCCRRNPDPCWTDRIPLPLLVMGFIAALGCCSVFTAASFDYVVFFFGRVVSGWAGLIIVLLISAACGYVGWGAFMQKMQAWWSAYAVILTISCSLMLTFAEVEMDVLYAHMGCTPDQIVQLSRYRVLNPAMLSAISGIWGAMACIYLVWVRDCFLPDTKEEEVKSYEQLMAEQKKSEEDPVPRRPRMRLDD
jgi:hypothetical protein